MLAKTFTATTIGLIPHKIEVEIDTVFGKPSLVIIGMASGAALEAKERITTALVNCGIRIKPRRTVVNLAPADLKKKSSAFDLAIAVAILKLYGIDTTTSTDTLFLGELALDGKLKPIVGALPIVLAAKNLGFKKVILPTANVHEVSVVRDVNVHPLSHLQNYIFAASHKKKLPRLQPKIFEPAQSDLHQPFQSIKGQAQAKRAAVIAAAGGHNLLLIGPPGSGKTLIAESLSQLLQPLQEKESLEVSSIHSLRNLTGQGIIAARPFRAVHPTISQMGLIGGGSQLQPGEISLAHQGVLFLDELAEFKRDCLESLRQPLEDFEIHLSRAQGMVSFPAHFTLVAATNPCPCGYYQSPHKACRCSLAARENYLSKLSGPILDRIDLHVSVQPIKLNSLVMNSAEIDDNCEFLPKKIENARKKQAIRYKNTLFSTNSELTNQAIKKYIQLSADAEEMLQTAGERLKLSARSYYKMIKVAQTIADLEEEKEIETSHMAEALQFRSFQL